MEPWATHETTLPVHVAIPAGVEAEAGTPRHAQTRSICGSIHVRRGYHFADYGPGKALTLAYLGRRAAPPVAVWFPACTSSTETGERRGCVVLARDAALVPLIDRMRTLRRWPASGE